MCQPDPVEPKYRFLCLGLNTVISKVTLSNRATFLRYVRRTDSVSGKKKMSMRRDFTGYPKNAVILEETER